MASNSRTIAMAAAAAGVAAMLAAAFAGYIPSIQNAMAQSDTGTTPQPSSVRRSLTYFATDTVTVAADGNASAQAFCEHRDVLLTGGYSIGFDTPAQAFNTMLYTNTALRIENSTSVHEGWQAGLVNMDTEPVTITANAVCLDVTPQ